MKKSFTLILFVFTLIQISFGQIIITEIMYNDPTSGTDTLEFIELYNAGSSTVDLSGYHFTAGVEDTIYAGSLDAGAFWVIAVDSASMRLALGVSTDQWNSGALRNGGELIELADANGNFVDSVNYSDRGDWPTQADGSGPSLVLCDFDADNSDPANWAAATTSTGVFIENKEVLANPGADSDCSTTPISYTKYDIATVTTENAAGVADSINTFCELQGIVLGVNIGADFNNIQFFMEDATGGIAVFDGGGGTNYNVQEGDEIVVQGFINQFRGLTQIIPDSIGFISAGNPISTPTVVTNLSEQYESELVRLNGVHIVDTSTWGDGASGFNVLVTTGGADTIDVRIDDNVNLFTTDVPTGTFDIIGIVNQRDFSEPFDDFYQLLPRYTADLITTSVSTNDPELGALIQLYPNPTDGLLTIELNTKVEQVQVYNQLGMLLQSYVELEGRQEVDLSGFSSGMYFVRFAKGDLQWVEKVSVR